MNKNITCRMKRLVPHRFIFTIAAVIATGGCASVTSNSTTSGKKMVLEAADEPSFEVAGIHILPQATADRTLPFVALPSGVPVESPCLERTTKSKQWTTANEQVLTALKRNEKQVSTSLLMWLQSQLPDDVPTADLSRWRATLNEETVMIRHFTTDDVRFAESQTCITNTVRMLAADAEVVTTLFGATGFSVQSQTPMSLETVQGLKKLAQKKRMRVKLVPTYQRAKDEKGRPMFEKGKPLFMAPNGTLVFRKDVPLPKKRPVFELEFTVQNGVYVARGDMPKSHFLTRQAPAETACKINLIFDDMTPRVPDCLGGNEIGFGVAMSENSGEVVVKAATVADTGQTAIPYDQTRMVQIGGTGFAWVTPSPLEEGAVLKVDTLVLHPKDTTPEDLKKFPYGN